MVNAPLLPFLPQFTLKKSASAAALLCLFASLCPTLAADLSEDFEGATGVPSGWTVFDPDSSGAFSIVTGHNGSGGSSGSGLRYAARANNSGSNPNDILGGFTQPSLIALGNQPFTVRFDMQIVETSSVNDDAAIVFGDLSDPYGQTSAQTRYFMLIFNETGSSNQFFAVNEGVRTANGSSFTGGAALPRNTWFHIELTWTPSSGTSGTAAFSLRRADNDTQVGSFSRTIDVGGQVSFGFGAYNDIAIFDNITIEFTEVSNTVTATNDQVEVGIGGAIGFDPTANDTTTIGTIDPATIQIITPPGAGAAAYDPITKKLVYQNTGSAAGSDSFRYRVSNTAGANGEADVSVAVSASLRLANVTLRMPDTPPPAGALQLVDAFPGMTFDNAVAMAPVPGSPLSLLVASVNGNVWMIPDTTAAIPRKVELFNVASRSNFTNGRSILSIACHPDFANNGQIIVNYQGDLEGLPRTPGGALDTANIPNLDVNTTIRCTLRIARFTISQANLDTLLNSTNTTAINAAKAQVLASEARFLNLALQGAYHTIDDCHFGPDGYLYASFGDEGEQDSRYENSQRITKDQYSSMLRIDVDKKPGNLEPNIYYAIPTDANGKAFFSVPADNPYVGSNVVYNNQTIPAQDLPKVRTEIWATGFRNPFKFQIDQETGDVWVADVGWTNREEVIILNKGDNCGWAYLEGTRPTGFASRSPVPPGVTFKAPEYEYPHSSGNNCIIGGPLYKGSAYSTLNNKYIFGDYGSGRIWTLTRGATPGNPTVTQLPVGTLADLAAIEVEPATGQLLFMQNQGSRRIYRLVEGVPTESDFPALLSQTGAFADMATLTPNPGVAPYTPNLAFWSDHARKSRFFAITNTTDQVGYSRDGNWTFPQGMVWVKHFDFDLNRSFPGTNTKRLETRFLVRNSSGIYGVSYRWNDAGTDATLAGINGVEFDVQVREGGTLSDGQVTGGTFITQKWQIPSRGDCLNCHNLSAGHALSFNTRQLNRAGSLNATNGNLLALLSQAGYLSGFTDTPASLPRFHSPDETGSNLEDRVRSYLAVNCSYCHQPGTSAPISWDARGHLSVDETGILYGQPLSETTADTTDRLIIPGNTTKSIIWNRIQARTTIGSGLFNGYPQMPPLATHVVDQQGVQLLSDWISNYANVAPSITAGSVAQAQVAENAPPGTLVGIVQASDPDSRNGVADNSQLNFAITGGDPNQRFTVNANGRVRVHGILDHETTPLYTLEITASDNFGPNPRTATHTVEVSILDVAENDLGPDSNGNGIPDAWEASFGLSNVDPAADADGDRISNFFEFIGGGDPTVADSAAGLALTMVDFVTEPSNGYLVRWRCRNELILGRDYFARRSSDIGTWTSLQPDDYEVVSVTPDGEGFSRLALFVPHDGDADFFRLSKEP
jgi:glucose/arabinose dehydrogenase